MNRRAFLRAGAVAVGLPFLESLPDRSAWAAGNAPVFSLFIVAACGVVGNKFFPGATGPLTTAGLGAMTDKATSVLAPHAGNLVFLKGINFPMNAPNNCGHAQGLCQSLTAAPAGGGGKTAYSLGSSVDMVIAQAVNPSGVDPLTLYAGNRQNGYIAERISFKASGAGQVRSADDNPYTLYSKLVGLTSSGGDAPATDPLADELLKSRKSVNDLVRAELTSLLNLPVLSKDDKQRLQQHFDAIRDAEVTMGQMGAACSKDGLATTDLDALKSGLAFKTNGMIEDVAKLHLELVALAFACNFNRVATLQHGDGTDQTKYNVPSNATLGWPFHHLSHRVQSDSDTGSNPTAEMAHAEIDVLRMKTLLHGLDQFKARGLFDKSIVMWTNHVADGPSHSFKNVPTIIAGDGGGYLKQGLYADAGNVTNNKLFNTLITAAVRDKTTWTTNFGQGTGSGGIDAIVA
ncbi:MAG TPA: DUF1552 domain-containing protein [Polyangiaceae bacterium]|nr:DUF1552 domain-containing protein [Polyangiaceae bacterium]